jgi:hypothetical protein
MAQEVTQLQLSVRKENFKDKYLGLFHFLISRFYNKNNDKYAAGEEAPDCLRQVGYRDRS